MIRVNPHGSYRGRNPSPEDGKKDVPLSGNSRLHRRGGIRRKHKSASVGVTSGSKTGKASLEKKVKGISEAHFKQSKTEGSHSKTSKGFVGRFVQWIRTFTGRGSKKRSPSSFSPTHPYIRLRTYTRSPKQSGVERKQADAETSFIETPKGILKKPGNKDPKGKHVHWKDS
ncbi:hypothetical protein CPK_ORF01010 [Chlamydia pneumoniae LPCoLN]|uniref:hypothetical protein n=1 Tax=Chlamydia pneumoniae TaxID=83558 RepID=UPI0001BD9E9B|nr:hypothetical protein [Chlamydia pneumoniae]ACZ33471.1 hypothetical protein CPK_ORF01010 [Chlamydia pneumoniae LPCoLN]ETR80393.1 hypothetical protein X556_0276 [Chlamydia pneumoniae B21]